MKQSSARMPCGGFCCLGNVQDIPAASLGPVLSKAKSKTLTNPQNFSYEVSHLRGHGTRIQVFPCLPAPAMRMIATVRIENDETGETSPKSIALEQSWNRSSGRSWSKNEPGFTAASRPAIHPKR
jgi:hypothetical protein